MDKMTMRISIENLKQALDRAEEEYQRTKNIDDDTMRLMNSSFANGMRTAFQIVLQGCFRDMD